MLLLGLQILSENSHNENAAIKENAGAKAASGTKLLAHEAVNAAMTSDIEALDEGEYADAEGLDAAVSCRTCFMLIYFNV